MKATTPREEQPGWEPLSSKESKEIARKFKHEFSFSPSVNKSDWPSIREKTPSITYSLLPMKSLNLEAASKAFLRSFQALSPTDDARLYALNWEHGSYWFYPKKVGAVWEVSPVPNGDYSIFLDPDFKFGIFAHPWEWSMNIFGASLLGEIGKRNPPLFSKVLRSKK